MFFFGFFFSLEFSKEALELTKMQESTLHAKYQKEMKVRKSLVYY